MKLDDIISKYVDENVFDTIKLKEYLNVHSVVGEEVFKYVIKKNEYQTNIGDETHTFTISNPIYEKGFGFKPLKKSIFIKRIPYYFYLKHKFVVLENDLLDIFLGYLETKRIEYVDASQFDAIFDTLDFLLYDLKIDIHQIFCYPSSQSGLVYKYDIFEKWVNYLKITNDNPLREVCPKNILFSYNEALVEHGFSPILYDYCINYGESYYFRNGDVIRISGNFPVDPKTNQVVKDWILVWIEDEEYIKTIKSDSEIPSLEVEIEIGLGPYTKIYLANYYLSDEEMEMHKNQNYNSWVPIYTGPLAMIFDYTELKFARENRRKTQTQVAEACGVNLRTYQYWECGKNNPDALSLIRIMNYLDIESVQRMVRRWPIEDYGFHKFMSGKSLTEFTDNHNV